MSQKSQTYMNLDFGLGALPDTKRGNKDKKYPPSLEMLNFWILARPKNNEPHCIRRFS